MKNFSEVGDTVDWTNTTGAAVTSGSVVTVGALVGVAVDDIADTETGALATEGVFVVAKVAGNAMAQGESVRTVAASANAVDVAAGAATGDVTGALVTWAAAQAADTTVAVKLGSGTVTP